MKELSLNILDVTKNSVTAGATVIEITLSLDSRGILTVTVKDDGCGMREDIRRRVFDPFYTTRTTRKVGMGLPLLKMAAEMSGGDLNIVSSTDHKSHGTTLTATFDTNNIDCMPMGDIVQTVCVLISGSPHVRFVFRDITPQGEVRLDTAELVEVLGGEISLAEPEIIEWICAYLSELYQNRNIG